MILPCFFTLLAILCAWKSQQSYTNLEVTTGTYTGGVLLTKECEKIIMKIEEYQLENQYTCYYVQMDYEFRIGFNKYMGTDTCRHSWDNRTEAQAYLKSMTGKNVPVYYDTVNPYNNYLFPGNASLPYNIIMIMSLFAACGTWFLFLL